MPGCRRHSLYLPSVLWVYMHCSIVDKNGSSQLRQYSFMSFTPQAVYIQDWSSGLVLKYKPAWYYLWSCNWNTIVCIQSEMTFCWFRCCRILVYPDGNAITAGTGSAQHDPLIVYPKRDGLDLSQVWIQNVPDNGTNPRFILMSAQTGLVMDVLEGRQDPGTRVQMYIRTNKGNQHAVCTLSVSAWEKGRRS